MNTIIDLIKSQAYKLNKEDVLILTLCTSRNTACYGDVYYLATGKVKAKNKFFFYTELLWEDVLVLTEEEALRVPGESPLQKELENLRIRKLRAAPEIEDELKNMHPGYSATIYPFES